MQRTTTAAAGAALAALLLAGCATGPDEAPASEAAAEDGHIAEEGATGSAASRPGVAETQPEAVERDESETTIGPSRAESFVPLPETAFTVDHAADGRHGLEVSVSFNVHRQAINNEGNVIRAISLAAAQYPDYDLIVVRGYSDAEMTDGNMQLIDAWYKPENVAQIDLDNPDEESAYEDCYSCSVHGRQR